MRRHPHLYETNARVLVRRLSEEYHRSLTLLTIPEDEWQFLARRGFDLIWLMGVWQRSMGARQEALLNASLRQEYDKTLTGWTDDDVAGSPYAVYDYNLDSALGEQRDLAQLKSRLNHQGLGLMLDFVPNHLAFDHRWTFSHPEWFVQGTEADVHNSPDWFFSPDGSIYLAHGKDPNFPPWNDTVQVNFYSNDMRQALINELLRIAEIADAVRCDMAMLALNRIFEQTWGNVVKDYPKQEIEFWAEAIKRVKRQRPDFLFLAEVYWGLERELQQIGFDFTYDKLLYDRLQLSTPSDIRSHLMMDDLYQQHSARFIENHDEPRAVIGFGRERSLAAAVVLATVPGLRLFHDGQLEGRNIRQPIQLVREPKEVDDLEIRQFYDQLLAICNAPAFHEGEWALLETSQPQEGYDRHHNLLAWSWRHGAQFKVVVVNYSPRPAQGRLKLLLPPKSIERVVFQEELTSTKYVPDPNEVRSQGLHVDLGPWHANIFDVAVG